MEEEQVETNEPEEQETVPDPIPKDGSWVPRVRMNEAVQSERERYEAIQRQLAEEREARIRLEERLSTRSNDKPKQTYTAAQLREHVDAGNITQEQADQILHKQWKEELREELSVEFEQRDRQRTVDQQIAHYIQLRPEVTRDGTDARSRLEEEYNFLIGIGEPGNAATKLKALRAACGPLETLESSGKRKRETHQETGGSGGGAVDRDTEGSVPRDLPDHFKSYFEGRFEAGEYQGWDDPKVKSQLKRIRAKRQG